MNSEITKITQLLKFTYGIVPIVAGLDKFTNILTDWSVYLPEGLAAFLPMEASTFMIVVGIIEIIAGVLVFIKPKEGAYVVMGWLIAIALVLLFSWSYVDVAVRDLVMAIGAFCLAKLYEVKMVVPNHKAEAFTH